MTLPKDGNPTIHWTFNSAPSVNLECPKANLSVQLGQDMKTGGDRITGPSVALRYPVRINLKDELGLEPALKLLNRVRMFFSLLMGRVLALEEASMRLIIEDKPHDMRFHGLIATQQAEKPAECIVDIEGPEELAKLLDQWLIKFESMKDAIRLHMDALEQRNLPMQMRFQIFVRAIEALHRKTSSTLGRPIDRDPILKVLQERGIPNDVIDRVGGVLAHAHEPGLRQRLKHYWDAFAVELAVLRPSESKKTFVGRVAATRNHYAHRTDKDDQVLEGGDLWDHTEAIKAISHMALLQEIGAKLGSIGQAMLNRRFAEFTIRT